jgi:hypothetical protein
VTYDDAVAVLRAWETTPVIVELEPDGTVMQGRLAELDPAGIDGVLFSLRAAPGERTTTGVAIALFRDSVRSAERRDGALVVEQGRVTLTVRPADEPPDAP